MAPDPRSAQFASTDYRHLVATAGRWRLRPEVPEDIGRLLGIARDLFAHGRFAYDFFTVAVVWSLLVLEAALKDRLARAGSRWGLKKLIDEAKAQGLVDPAAAERLRAAARLRNMFAHPERYVVLTPGLAAELLEAAHREINRLYEGGRSA